MTESSSARKKLLFIITLLMCICGLLAASIPFFLSLTPNPNSYSNLPHIDVSNMRSGDTIEYNSDVSITFINK